MRDRRMPEVVVVGSGPLADRLTEHLRAAGGCRRSPTSELEGLEGGAGTWVYAAKLDAR